MSDQKPIAARQGLLRLIQGNKRFMRKRKARKPIASYDASWFQAKPRGPFAIVLACSDARAPAEIIFDQGLGDLFVIRVAGNIVAPSQVGSVEFAAATMAAELVVVIGHTQCGAVRATIDSLEGKKGVPTENIQSIVSRISPHIERIVGKKSRTRKEGQVWRDSVRANVLASTDHLRHGSRLLEELVQQGKLVIVGAEYDIDTGKVDFFDNPLSKEKKKARK